MAVSTDLLDTRLGDLLDELASEAPTPGGGSAAAIAVAMAAGLVAMAARLSRAEWPEAGGAIAQAEALRVRVAPLAQRDAEAYEQALAALRPPKELEPEARDAVIGEALSRAAEVPLAIAEAAADVAELAAVVAEKGNPAVRPDAAAAALFAEAGARTAANLVAVNLATTEDDPRARRAREAAAAASAAAGAALAAGS